MGYIQPTQVNSRDFIFWLVIGRLQVCCYLLVFVSGTAVSNANSASRNKVLCTSDAKLVRKELQEIRDRVNYLLDSLDSGEISDRYGVSAMADALQEKTSGIGVTSSSSLDPSDSRSSPALKAVPISNGPFNPNNITSENSKEFDPFNTAQKTSSTFQQPQRVPDDQVSISSHTSSTAATVRQEPEISSSGGGFQRPDVASMPTSIVAPQQQQPGGYQGAYNPTGYSMQQQPAGQSVGPSTIPGPPTSGIQSPPQVGQVGQQQAVQGTVYNPYPQQQQGYQQHGVMQTPNQVQTTGPSQVPPVNQTMYPQQYQQATYTSGGQQSQGAPPPRGPPIGPPQTMTAPGTNPYGMAPRGQGLAGSNGTFSRYPQAPAYR